MLTSSFLLKILLGFQVSVFANQEVCESSGPIDHKDFVELRRQVDSLGLEDVRRYCNYQMSDRFSRSLKEHQKVDLGPYWAKQKSLDEVLSESKLVLKLTGDKQNTDPWSLSLLPAPNLRMNAALKVLGISSKIDFLPPNAAEDQALERLSSYFAACAEKNKCGRKKNPASTVTTIEELKETPFLETRMRNLLKDKSTEIALLKACSELTILKALNCKDGALKSAKFVAPDQVGFFSAAPLYVEILQDGSYAKGLSIFAQKLLKKEKDSRGQTVQGNVFDEMQEAFKESGLDSKKANEMAWNVMGLWSTAGANLGGRLDSLSVPAKAGASAEALKVMTALLPVLDARSEGQVYSFPKEVKNSCDNGKAYHFWMSAFLARKNTKESGDPVGSAASSSVMQKGYQILGRATEKNVRRADQVLKYDSFHSVQNVVRVDMNLANAGAVFGAAAGAGQTVSLDADEGLRKMHNDGEISTGKTPPSQNNPFGHIESYKSWSKVFNPNPQFQRYLKDSGL